MGNFGATEIGTGDGPPGSPWGGRVGHPGCDVRRCDGSAFQIETLTLSTPCVRSIIHVQYTLIRVFQSSPLPGLAFIIKSWDVHGGHQVLAGSCLSRGGRSVEAITR